MESLRIAMEMERRGYLLYRRAEKLIRDPDMLSLLEHLAQDESIHFAFFHRLYQQRSYGSSQESAVPQLEESLAAEAFYPGGLMQAAWAGGLETRLALFNTAIQAEVDSIAYYEKLLSSLPEDHRRDLQTIIEEEKKHLWELTRQRDLELSKK